MPASPSSRTTRPDGVAARQAAVMAADSASRPMSGAGSTGGRASRPGRRRRLGLDASLPDRVVQLGRLAKRRHAELAVEQRNERSVLADRTGAIARTRQQVHDATLARFVERIEVHPPSGCVDGAGRITAVAPGGRQPVEQVADQSLDARPPSRLPVVEVGAVSEREAGQERAAGQRGRGLEILRAIGRREALQLQEVDPCRPWIHGHPGTVDGDAGRPTALRSADRVRRSAPRAASSSASGQNIAASSSRAYGRPSAATRATMASALRVSTLIGRPSTTTSSGPSRWIRSAGASIA